MPTEIICKACVHGPCKLGDVTLICGNPDAPVGVSTVQDMVNYTAVQDIKTKE